jgi:hypothetical protein
MTVSQQPGSPSAPELIVRGYAEGDYRACRALWAELTEYHRSIYRDPSISGDDPGAGFDGYLATPQRIGSWVAESRGRIVGLTGLLDQCCWVPDAGGHVDLTMDLAAKDLTIAWLLLRPASPAPPCSQARVARPGPFAGAFARLVTLAPRPAEVSALDPPPSWAAWNHAEAGLWPHPEDPDVNLNEVAGPVWIDDTGRRALRQKRERPRRHQAPGMPFATLLNDNTMIEQEAQEGRTADQNGCSVSGHSRSPAALPALWICRRARALAATGLAVAPPGDQRSRRSGQPRGPGFTSGPGGAAPRPRLRPVRGPALPGRRQGTSCSSAAGRLRSGAAGM